MLQLALRYERLLNAPTKRRFLLEGTVPLWEIIMIYVGDLATIKDQFAIEIRDLKGETAQVYLQKQQIGNLSDNPQVVYLELPSSYQYIDSGLGQVCASSIGRVDGRFQVTGENVLLGVIDSGIDYAHPDFRQEDGTTRIQYLWDQTLEGTAGVLKQGKIFDKNQIDRALQEENKKQQQNQVPSTDDLGHGTALAGIAAGNGRGSVGQNNRGVAPDCELVIVKLGKIGDRLPTDLEIMGGIDFCLEKAKILNKPITLLLGIGNNLTGHDGRSLLEQYIAKRKNSWSCNIVVGTGNEGDKGSHASGKIEEGQSQTIELLVEGERQSYACSLWKPFSDTVSFVLEAPNGETTEVLSSLTPNRAYLFDETAVLINFSQPTLNIERQEIFILFQGQADSKVSNGIWRLTITGETILQGDYHIWGSMMNQLGDQTRFLNPALDRTLTSPATTPWVTAVGAYNGFSMQLAAFSGRGFTLGEEIKPDIVAPGVNVVVASAMSPPLYTVASGTSLSAAFVAGAYILMMSYGIFRLGNQNAYGEILKIYLRRSAKRSLANAPYPNRSWGYGTLCIEAALQLMKEVDEKTQ